MLEISPASLHIWFAFANEIQEPGLLSRYLELLTPEERQRHQRFYFEKDRHLYLVARALLQTVLSNYAPIRPGDWQFKRNRYGKPEIIEGAAELPLRFNLSHTKGMVMCGVTLGHDIGVDIEHYGRATHGLKIAERFFSPQEAHDIKQLPPERQGERFIEYWTLKEAYIKAKGMGLSLPLESFSFRLGDRQTPRISFPANETEDPAQWRFMRFAPSADYLAAVALRSNTVIPSLKTYKSVPLARQQSLSLEPF